MLVVLKWDGDDRMLHLNANWGTLAVATAGQTAGHATARGAFGGAAVDWFNTQVGTWPPSIPGPFTGIEPVETFNSDGPRRIHYEADGTPITPGDQSSSGGELRQKPDIAAADDVSTATPGFSQFFRTSAAAPHAAAIGAQMLAVKPDLTPAQARSIFNATALDAIFSDGFELGHTSAWSSSVGGL